MKVAAASIDPRHGLALTIVVLATLTFARMGVTVRGTMESARAVAAAVNATSSNVDYWTAWAEATAQ